MLVLEYNATITASSFVQESLWQARQNWRSIGTDSGPTQTLSHAEVDFEIEERIRNVSVDQSAEMKEIVIGAISSTTSQIRSCGVFRWIEEVIQRAWADEFYEWDGYLNEEADGNGENDG